MCDGLILVSKRSNWISFMIHMYMEFDIDDKKFLHQMLFDNNLHA
jgi:hypothetical protein